MIYCLVFCHVRLKALILERFSSPFIHPTIISQLKANRMKARSLNLWFFCMAALVSITACTRTSPSTHYIEEGDAKSDKGDLTGAIAAYDQAVASDPSNSIAYGDRGAAKQAIGDMKGALNDLNKALSLDPNNVSAYTSRGFIRRAQGDLEGAIADYSSAIAVHSGDSIPLSDRGLARQDKGDLTDAISDYRQALELHTDDKDYVHFFLWSAQALQDQKKQADAELSTYIAQRPGSADAWPLEIAKFLLGQISEADFLKAAPSDDPWQNSGHLCEAWYYAGLKRLIAGDKTSAIEAFQKSVGTNRQDFVEYSESLFQINKLK